ncbi:hypothetical protein PFISCL1PPCAC_12086, partial [Pristionchus fissidentatus]
FKWLANATATMDDGFQQKKNRLDSLSSRLARGNAQARTGTREEARKCKGCSAELAAGAVGETCSNCSTPGGSGATLRRVGMCCPICGVGVQPVGDFLTCSICKKWIHSECDRSIDVDTEEYSCAKCRHSPLEGEDAMIGGGADSPLADPEASNQGTSLLGSIRSSPFAGSIGGESGRYSQRERRMSGSSESSSYSARNSPSFDPNALSEDDEEFRPGSRGGGASRGGRGGKKKPGGRGGTLMKTRSGGKPPSGVFSDRLGKTDRGKRGKGGRGKAGNTGKGRGAAASGRRTSTTRGGLGMSALPFFSPAAVGSAALVALQQVAAAKAAAVAAAGGGAPPDDGSSANQQSAVAKAAAKEGRGGKDDEYVRTIVVAPEDDVFLNAAPLCLVCGSVGRHSEQSMVACSGCAHTFHTYCVGLHDKMNETVVKLGWRCLDCTICEGCGHNKDDSKLIMCEECDVAYHMYCLNPPVERAPTGPWRCQWCARCRRCTKRVANSGELTKEGLCYPCLSLRKCPKCSKLYNLNDNIIRCSQCSKWYHGACEDLHSEEMLESAALNKMRCSSCRPNALKNSCYSSANDGNLILCDNVALNKCADEVLQSKMMPSLFRANSFTSGDSQSQLGSLLSEFRSGGSMDSHFGASMDDDNGPEEENGLSSLMTFGPGSRGGRGGGRGGGAGRGGRQLKLGVGGFFVKLPKHKLIAAEEEENAATDPNDPTKKVKRQRKPRRSQLEDAYPSQIQEGFFGAKPVDGKALIDVDVTEPVLEDYREPKMIKDPFALGDTLSMEASEALRNDINEASMLDNINLNDMMNIDDMDFNLFDDNDDDDFNDFDNNLSDAFDIMKNDNDSQPKPEMEDGNSQPAPVQPMQQMQQQPIGFQPGMGPNGMLIKQEPGVMNAQQQHQHQMMLQQQHHLQQQQQHGMGPGGMMIKQEPGMMRPDSSMSGGSGGMMPAAVGHAHGGVGIQERASASAAATERWEEDEPLGDKATKAAVLYVNIAHPTLRQTMPLWSERAKFIHREWRRLSPDDRQIYVRKARDNRAQREKVPRPRIPRIPQPGVPGPSGLATCQPGMGPMRMGAGGGSGPGGPGGYGIPGGLGGSMRGPLPPPSQPPSLDHLPPDLQQEYVVMKKASNDLHKTMDEVEKELGNLRQTKKKLNAKQRQIKKTAETAALNAATAAAAAAGQPPPTSMPPTDADLNDNDKESLARALDGIPNKQREVEEAKKNYKAHVQAMHEFESRHRIQTEFTTSYAAHQRAGMGSGGPTVGGMLTASMGRAGMAMSMAGPPGGPGGYQQMVVPQQVPFSQMMGPERGFQLGAIPGPGPGMMMGGRMAAMGGRWGPPQRSMSLGGLRYEQLQSQEEREVYECVDDMIGKISCDLDGPPPMMQQPQGMGGFPGGGPSLKRLLDPMAPPPMGMPPMMQADDGAPKTKKKRVMQKKTPLPGGNDYEACKERLMSALGALPPMPRKTTEPAPRNESSPFAIIGMGDLGEKYVVAERSADSRVTLGNLTLPFARDVYKNLKTMETATDVSMAQLMPSARISLLHQMCQPSSSSSPSTPNVIRDEGDRSAPSTSQCGPPCGDVLRNLVGPVEKRRGMLRCSSKAPDWTSSLPEPHRIAFKETKKEEDEEVEIAIEIEERGILGMSGGESSWANSTSSTPCREEVTKQLLLKLQQMLDTKKPIEDYQMDTPPQSPSLIEAQHVDIKPSLHQLHSSSLRCRLCSREINAGSCNTGVRQSMSLLGLTPSDDGKDDSVTFCTLKCYYMFVATAKVALSPEQLAKAEAHVDEQTYSRLKQISADSFARCINQSSMVRVKAELTVGAALAAGFGSASLASAGPPAPTPIGGVMQQMQHDLISPRDNRFSSLLDEPAPRKENVHVIRCMELAQLADTGKRDRSRAAGEDWKKYNQELLDTFLRIRRMKNELSAAQKMGVESVPHQIDTRYCVLCCMKGDGEPSQCGRLLNYDSCGWVHANCALWSSEVYESATGALVNVDRAILRGTITCCHLCGRGGATLQCYKLDCKKNFHVSCACKINGKFLKDKTFICPNHVDVHIEMLISLEPLRRLYIHREENKLLAKLFEPTDGTNRLMMRLGALTFHRLGQLLPEQLKTCHSDRFIFPLGYSAQRMFWSPHDARRRVKYTLSITEHEGKPLFTVSMPPPRDDLAVLQGHPPNTTPIVWKKPTAEEAWREVLDGVVRCRSHSGVFLRLAQLEPECLFGLGEGVITKMTESLPGVETLYSYSFRHGGAPILELPLAENPSGCARCEPRMRTLIKSHRRPVPSGSKPSTSSGGPAKRTQSLYEELQMCMKASGYRGDFGVLGTNGKWDQYGSTEQSYSAYQKMRKEWRNTVYLARSKIQGLGLYAKRDIDMGSMIIEYKGEIIRAEVCEMREKRYFAQNRGTYMFKASEECIIDATMKGGPARYVNHSCDPNCATQIMHLGTNGEDKKIIITANRPIKADEELTYDYQFDEEDASDKLACLCGAPNCKKVMN